MDPSDASTIPVPSSLPRLAPPLSSPTPKPTAHKSSSELAPAQLLGLTLSLLPPTIVRLATDTVIRDNRQRREPRILGKGAFATLYAAEEEIAPATPHSPHRRSLTRDIAVKVFNHTQGDWQSVFYAELAAYRHLSPHKNFVDVRGAVEYMPPTFVCTHPSCGRTFQVTRCPACLARGSSSALRNDTTGLALTCDEGHRFGQDDLRALTALRPCAHTDECAAVNFLVRPYIFLEQLSMSVEQLNMHLLPERSHPGAPAFIFGSSNELDRKREVMLLRLDVLLGCAEGLAHCHDRQQLFVDLKPDNVMVQLARQGPNVPTTLTAVKLIDPGRVRSIKERRTSATPVGDATFLAPEQSADPHQIGQVRVRFLGGQPRPGDLCVLETSDGRRLDLEPGDYVFNDESSYEIVSTNSLSPQDLGALGLDGTQQMKGRCARVIAPPPADSAGQPVYLQYHQAVSVPADVYSFGCFAAWFLSGGKQKFVKTLRACADLATLKRRVVDERCLDEILGDERGAIARELDLPDTGFDDQIHAELLLLLLRCLVRSDGTYCPHRSCEFANPARDIARDLKHAQQKLFVVFKTRSEAAPLDLGELEAAESARQREDFQRRIDELQQRHDTLQKQHSQLEQQAAVYVRRSRRCHVWHTFLFFLVLLAVPIAVVTVAVNRSNASASSPSAQPHSNDPPRNPSVATLDAPKPAQGAPSKTPPASQVVPRASTSDKAIVPDLRQALSSAGSYAKSRGFEIVVAAGKGDMVVTQDPPPGTEALKGSKIRITLGEQKVVSSPTTEPAKR